MSVLLEIYGVDTKQVHKISTAGAFPSLSHSHFKGATLISAAGNGIAPILDYQFELSIERIKQQCLVLIYKMEMDISEKNECEGQGNQPTEGLPEKAWAWGKKN